MTTYQDLTIRESDALFRIQYAYTGPEPKMLARLREIEMVNPDDGDAFPTLTPKGLDAVQKINGLNYVLFDTKVNLPRASAELIEAHYPIINKAAAPGYALLYSQIRNAIDSLTTGAKQLLGAVCISKEAYLLRIEQRSFIGELLGMRYVEIDKEKTVLVPTYSGRYVAERFFLAPELSDAGPA